jgi:hypothetical protein
LIKFNCILYFFSVDEGSYKPEKKLANVRELSEEAFKIAHKLKLLKTKEEAVVESDSN